MLSVSTRYALRCLLRHRRRSFLSVLGVAVGCASSLVTISFVRGEGEMFMRGVAESGVGHLRVAPAGWRRLRENDLRLDGWRAELERIRATDGVKVATPRARTNGLLGAGTRTVGLEVVGTDPGTERAANRLLRGEIEGRYLEAGGPNPSEIAVVVGKAVAERLDVGLGDQVMVTMTDAEGEMQQAMLRIVGLVSTGNEDIDAMICHMPLEDVERLTGLEGAGEIAVLLENHKHVDRAARRLAVGLRGRNEILRWYEVSPEVADAVTIDESFTWLTVAIVVVLVFLGITSAQLTAVLERRREFAVLSALGMRGRQLVRVMFLEGLVIGLVGAVLGLAMTLPPVYLMSAYGIDLTRFFGERELVMSEVLVDPILYGDMGVWLVPYGLVISTASAVLASIYPAVFAARTDPAAALRVV